MNPNALSLLTHTVPAWTLVALTLLFLAYLAYRAKLAALGEEIHLKWMENSKEHMKMHGASIEVLARMAEAARGDKD